MRESRRSAFESCLVTKTPIDSAMKIVIATGHVIFCLFIASRPLALFPFFNKSFPHIGVNGFLKSGPQRHIVFAAVLLQASFDCPGYPHAF